MDWKPLYEECDRLSDEARGRIASLLRDMSKDTLADLFRKEPYALLLYEKLVGKISEVAASAIVDTYEKPGQYFVILCSDSFVVKRFLSRDGSELESAIESGQEYVDFTEQYKLSGLDAGAVEENLKKLPFPFSTGARIRCYWKYPEDVHFSDMAKEQWSIYHRTYRREELVVMTFQDLKRILGIKDLSTDGSQEELINRILAVPQKPLSPAIAASVAATLSPEDTRPTASEVQPLDTAVLRGLERSANILERVSVRLRDIYDSGMALIAHVFLPIDIIRMRGFERFRGVWAKLSAVALIVGLIYLGFSLFMLTDYVMRSQVTTSMNDDAFHLRILSELRGQPTAYKEAYDRAHRQFYGDAPNSYARTPILFYMWVMLPDVQSIRWLYLAFAFIGSIASYFTVVILTKSRPLAALSAAWIAYYMQKSFYLMFEHWAIAIFLVAVAFFVAGRHVWAAAAMFMSAFVKEVFILFLPCATVCYLLAGRKREAYVWGVATLVEGVVYFAYRLWTNSIGLEAFRLFVGLDLQLDLQGLFDVSSYFFNNPPLPLAINMGLALIGISLLNKHERIVMYVSFVSMPLLTFTGRGLTGPLNVGASVLSRWISMSITMINLFWLPGLYQALTWTPRERRYKARQLGSESARNRF